MRHGDVQPYSNFNNDFNRPLSKVGEFESKKMGAYAGKIFQPDIVISSSAKRAHLTANIAVESGKWDCPIILERRIYGGPPKLLIDLINKQNDKFSSIFLVGHEPNFSRFVIETTCSSHIHFPTAAIAKIDFELQ